MHVTHKAAGSPAKSSQRGSTSARRSVRSKGGEKIKNFVSPMLAQLHDTPFDDNQWIFEIKWDGYRAIAELEKSHVALYSRNGLSFKTLYPSVTDALSKMNVDAVLDGEIVVLDKDGKADFQKLQQYDPASGARIHYCVFDCLAYKGKSLLSVPLLQRKEILKQIVKRDSSGLILFSEHIASNGTSFYEKVKKLNLEGIIAKRADSHYLPGKRSGDWLKIKNHNTQEAIIAGYTEPRGSRSYFGALVLAIKSGKKLRYIGHTGTGFNSKMLASLFKQFQPLIVTDSPFNEKIAVNGKVTWLKPELVCQVKYTELTSDGIMRHPVFMGLRRDKEAAETTVLDLEHTPDISRKDQKDPKKKTVIIHKHEVTLTNLGKIWWPDERITKGDVIEYYNTVHQYILPYLKNRPQSLRRNPNGISDDGFFQKEAGQGVPDWVTTVLLPATSVNRNINYILCNNLETLLYLNNLGCIELNAWNSRVSKLDHPDYMVLDIDPGDTNDFEQVIECALVIKEIFDSIECPAYCKTSGASGLHVFVPLHAQYQYETVRNFAEAIANQVVEQLPTTTTERSLSKRNGRIYIDYEQNKKGQTVASVYSARPKPGATVSTPLLWSEVKTGLHPSQFTIKNIVNRLNKKGDIFSGVLSDKPNLKKYLKNLKS